MPRVSATSKTASKSATKTKSVAPAKDLGATAKPSKAPVKGASKSNRPATAAGAGKRAPARKTVTDSPQSSGTAVSNEERYLYVAEAAYYLAERDGFSADPVEYWLRAECEVDEMISRG